MPVGVEGELPDEVALVEDVAVESGDDDGDGVTDVGGTEGDVVSAADADDSVGSDFEVPDVGGLVDALVGWSGFWGGGVNFCWDTTSDAAVGTGVVVDVGKTVELGLELFDGCCWGLDG